MPWEATKENTFSGCLAFEGSINGQRRISTNLNYKVTNHSETTDSDPVPTDDRWNQFVTETKGYRDGAFEAAEKANARAEDAEAASEGAQAAARAAKASENAAAASASDAAADAAKAGPYAEAARAAQKAAENAAAAAAASKSAADTLAAEAARAALAAENSKTAANNAAYFAGENATAAQQAADTATAAANDAGQSASDAAASKAAAETAAKAAQDAQTAAATAKAEAVKAQGTAQTAAKSAQDAQAAAENVRDDAKTAQKGAEAARDTAAKSAEAAAKSEANAKQSADTLAESVKNITPDDSSIGGKPWSSKHIIDMLCPPLEESGNPVVCYPVAEYPLGVKAKWEPTQEGSVEPSPENIRPINGRDSVTVNRADGLRAWGMLTLDGTEHWIASDNVVEGMRSYFVPNAVAVTNTPIATRSTEVCTHYRIMEYNAGVESALLSAEPYAYIVTNRFDSVEELKAYLAAQHAAGTPVQIAYKLKKPAVVPDTNGIFFSEQPAQGGMGDPSPDNIRPILINNTVQVGQTNTLTLPETVYGGEVDAVTGDGNNNTKIITLDGNELKFRLYNNVFYNLPPHSTPGISAQAKVCCSHFDAKFFGTNASYEFCFLSKSDIDGLFASADDLNVYLAAQYAAGTPVQIAYKLAEPVPFTATGAQPIPALAGVNTVLSDADSVTVTGRADPIKRITDLEDAVASQT